jgi:hypothetical protein
VGGEGSPSDLKARIEAATRELGLSVVAADALPKVASHAIGVPRIAIVHDWLNTQNEGWWRIAFDRAAVPFTYISVHELAKNAALRDRFDVIVYPPVGNASVPRQIQGVQSADAIPWMPTEKYPNFGGPDKTDDMRGGIGFDGLAHLRTFVEQGGLLVAAASSAVLPIRVGLVEAVDIADAKGLRASGGVYRATVSDKTSPIAYGYGETLPVYFNQAPLFEAGPAVALGGASAYAQLFGPPTQGRVSGRGGAKDPDIPQGRAYVAPPEAPKTPPETVADLPEEILDFVRNLLPPESGCRGSSCSSRRRTTSGSRACSTRRGARGEARGAWTARWEGARRALRQQPDVALGDPGQPRPRLERRPQLGQPGRGPHHEGPGRPGEVIWRRTQGPARWQLAGQPVPSLAVPPGSIGAPARASGMVVVDGYLEDAPAVAGMRRRDRRRADAGRIPRGEARSLRLRRAPLESVAPPISPDRVTFRILPFGSVDVTSRSEDSGHAGFSIGPFDRTVNGHVRDDADYPLKW